MQDPSTGADPQRGSRGSALLAAVFVIVLLTSMGLILLFVSQTDVTISKADLEAKKAFYLAEAGTEHGREQLRLDIVAAGTHAMDPRLDQAAGTNDTIDLDPTDLRPQFSGGALTGFTGTGDDVPLVGPTALGDGWYAAYLTNDPADGETNLTDSNEFVMVTGIGVGRDGSVEVAQAIVQPGMIFPALPATITLLGPNPDFEYKSGKGWSDTECPEQKGKWWIEGEAIKAGASKFYKAYNGTDCPPYRKESGTIVVGSKTLPVLAHTGGTGGTPGLFMPTYGVVGNGAENQVENELKASKIHYLSDMPGVRTQIVKPATPVGNWQNEDTIADLTDASEPTVIGSGLGTLDPTWQDCNAVKQIVERLRTQADYLCTPPGCVLPATSPSFVTFIDGDFVVPCGAEGWGLLVVTGALDFPATASWHGIVLVIGEGWFFRIKKEGIGNITGGMVVANIAGPDAVYGTADDCTGGPNGFRQVFFREFKKARGTTAYCSAEIAAADPGWEEPTQREAFRQR